MRRFATIGGLAVAFVAACQALAPEPWACGDPLPLPASVVIGDYYGGLAVFVERPADVVATCDAFLTPIRIDSEVDWIVGAGFIHGPGGGAVHPAKPYGGPPKPITVRARLCYPPHVERYFAASPDVSLCSPWTDERTWP